MAAILFIACDYYAYTDRIEQEMTTQGHTVCRFPIEPRGALNKGLRRFAPDRHRRSLARHHRRILSAIEGRTFDLVVCLQGHQFSEENLAALRTAQSGARFILYNWDSLTTHDYRANLRLFDAAATFDPEDAATLGIHYLPLFALPEYFEVAASPDAPSYDLYFVGSVHSMARYEAIRRLADHCNAEAIRLKLYLHCSPPRYLDLLRRGKLMKGMTLRSIGTDAIIAMMRDARAVFDFASHRQSGYTMRLIENLCAGKKIVTANRRVLAEPFYSPDRFLALDPTLDLSALKAFIDRPLTDRRGFEQFSLAQWACRLLAL